MITTTTAESKVTTNIVNLYENDIAGLKMEIRMLTKHDENNLLPYYEAALEILTKNKSK